VWVVAHRKVVDLARARGDRVTVRGLLEELTEAVDADEVAHLVILVETRDGRLQVGWSNGQNPLEVIGLLELGKHKVMSQMYGLDVY
jgi:hypothetical protein